MGSVICLIVPSVESVSNLLYLSLFEESPQPPQPHHSYEYQQDTTTTAPVIFVTPLERHCYAVRVTRHVSVGGCLCFLGGKATRQIGSI